MGGFLLTATSGWLALTAFATALVIPLGVRALRISGLPRKRFMTLHFVLGTVVPLIAFAHAAIPMESDNGLALIGPGLGFASAALLLLLIQVALGISLRAAMAARSPLRAIHLATMLALTALIAAHIFMDRA